MPREFRPWSFQRLARDRRSRTRKLGAALPSITRGAFQIAANAHALIVDGRFRSLPVLDQLPRQKAWADEDDDSKYEETNNDGDPPSTLRAISHPGGCTHRQKKRGAIKYSVPQRRHGIHPSKRKLTPNS